MGTAQGRGDLICKEGQYLNLGENRVSGLCQKDRQNEPDCVPPV